MSEAQTSFSVDSLDLDGRVKRSEVKEIQKLGSLESEALKVTINTKNKLKTFLNTEYRWANENYMKPLKVSDMQTALHVVADNAFGSGTFQALIQFQKDNGLTTDGLCGPKTQAVLFADTEEAPIQVVEKTVSKKKRSIVQQETPIRKPKTSTNSGKKRSIMTSFLEHLNTQSYSEKTEKSQVGPPEYSRTIHKVCQQYDLSVSLFLTLIKHENSKWDHFAVNQSSKAYGLGQMIPSTWDIHGKGLDKHNPHDQLEASARYLSHIITRNKCSQELALAFYNTGEYFDHTSASPVGAKYMNNNSSIVNKIPDGRKIHGLSKRDYFIGAVAYYNDLTFTQAKDLV